MFFYFFKRHLRWEVGFHHGNFNLRDCRLEQLNRTASKLLSEVSHQDTLSLPMRRLPGFVPYITSCSNWNLSPRVTCHRYSQYYVFLFIDPVEYVLIDFFNLFRKCSKGSKFLSCFVYSVSMPPHHTTRPRKQLAFVIVVQNSGFGDTVVALYALRVLSILIPPVYLFNSLIFVPRYFQFVLFVLCLHIS